MPYPARVDPESLGDLALAAVEEHGWQGWTQRHVARAAGVSPNALYRHAGDRDGLAAAAGAAAAGAVETAVRDAALGAGTPRQALVDAVAAYLVFARSRPDAYEAFVRAKPAAGSPHATAWKAPWWTLRDLCAAVVPGAGDATAFAVWALAHGHADLVRGPAPLPDPERALADALDALLTGMQVAGTVPSPRPRPHSPTMTGPGSRARPTDG